MKLREITFGPSLQSKKRTIKNHMNQEVIIRDYYERNHWLHGKLTGRENGNKYILQQINSGEEFRLTYEGLEVLLVRMN